MQKKIGAILLIAGTCIGSGMIALPMVLAKLGIIPSILLMLLTWLVMYYTSLINIELNLQAGHGMSLGALGKHFSGKKAKLIGNISLKILSYSLLAVFIYGGSSVLQELIASKTSINYSLSSIATTYSLVTIGLLLLPLKLIDHINRILFIGLITVIAILSGGLTYAVDWSDLPLFTNHYSQLSLWTAIIPVVFTSFGFQVIFHTLTNYCNKHAKILKTAFLWGSLIPAIVYIVWTCNVLSVVHHHDPSFYQQMASGNIEIGALIQVLSHIAKSSSVQLLVWWISLLAIATSVLGVGIGLCDSLKVMIAKNIPSSMARHLLSPLITVIPAYLVAVYVPNAFIAVLGFAGMILAVIAILLPIYLFYKIQTPRLHYPELRIKWMIRAAAAAGLIVIVSQLYTML